MSSWALRSSSGGERKQSSEGPNEGSDNDAFPSMAAPAAVALAFWLSQFNSTEGLPALESASPPEPPLSLETLLRCGLVGTWDNDHYGLSFSDPVTAGRLLFERGLLWQAVLADAKAAGKLPDKYMAGVKAKALTFIPPRTPGGPLAKLVNHEATLGALRKLGTADGVGKLWLLTGPRSVGKSFMLQKVAQELGGRSSNNCSVLYVDGRQRSDLVPALADALSKDEGMLAAVIKALPPAVGVVVLGVATSTLLAGVVSAIGAAGAAKVAEGIVTAVGAVDSTLSVADRFQLAAKKGAVPLSDLLDAYLTACKARNEYPVILIDEANRFLVPSAADQKQVLDTLELFVRVTKQQGEASVVMATSEHGFPFRLRRLGWKTEHVKNVIVAEEVPPAVMKTTLMSDWGCGEKLALGLMSLYGGHLMYSIEAVSSLAHLKQDFEGSSVLGTMPQAPSKCLSDETLAEAYGYTGRKPEELAELLKPVRAEMTPVVTAKLEELVRHGSVPLATGEERFAEIISHANAGCVVSRSSARAGVAAGVPPGIWTRWMPSGEDPAFVLLPSSHTMRLLLAHKYVTAPHRAKVAAGEAAAPHTRTTGWWPWRS